MSGGIRRMSPTANPSSVAFDRPDPKSLTMGLDLDNDGRVDQLNMGPIGVDVDNDGTVDVVITPEQLRAMVLEHGLARGAAVGPAQPLQTVARTRVPLAGSLQTPPGVHGPPVAQTAAYEVPRPVPSAPLVPPAPAAVLQQPVLRAVAPHSVPFTTVAAPAPTAPTLQPLGSYPVQQLVAPVLGSPMIQPLGSYSVQQPATPVPTGPMVQVVERPVYIEKVVEREKPVYIDRIVEVEKPGKNEVRKEIVETPVFVDRIVEKPVYIESERTPPVGQVKVHTIPVDYKPDYSFPYHNPLSTGCDFISLYLPATSEPGAIH